MNTFLPEIAKVTIIYMFLVVFVTLLILEIIGAIIDRRRLSKLAHKVQMNEIKYGFGPKVR